MPDRHLKPELLHPRILELGRARAEDSVKALGK
jgi:hypothetical protein